jgi:hypothetical protein
MHLVWRKLNKYVLLLMHPLPLSQFPTHSIDTEPIIEGTFTRVLLEEMLQLLRQFLRQWRYRMVQHHLVPMHQKLEPQAQIKIPYFITMTFQILINWSILVPENNTPTTVSSFYFHVICYLIHDNVLLHVWLLVLCHDKLILDRQFLVLTTVI